MLNPYDKKAASGRLLHLQCGVPAGIALCGKHPVTQASGRHPSVHPKGQPDSQSLGIFPDQMLI
ncbi:hypothetical protein [Vandammella animalimorsus]|uniref:hypothetical protein n=1 Tax=Vandammella animalimorsus TaxID=2029117 RepID=UPI0011814032|nr:hypothetical protein [Vandammella animalimorsus]